MVRRFLAIRETQFILVDTDSTKYGWGMIRFVGNLQVYIMTVSYVILDFFLDCVHFNVILYIAVTSFNIIIF